MALVVTIAGVNRSTVVAEDSIRITQLADSFTFTAELDIYDEDSDISITTGSHKVADEISLVDGAVTYFGGYIANQDIETKEGGSRMLHLQCQGYGILLTETLVEYEEYIGTADDAIIDDLFDTYLAAIDSVTDVAQLDAGMDILFSEMTLAEIMEALCKRTGGRFYIDNVKNLHYFADENDDCGFDLSDTPNQVTSFSYYDANEKRIDASQIVNRVRVIGADGFAVYSNSAASQAAYGIRSVIVTDQSLTTTAEMQERGDAIRDKNKDPKVSYSLRTTKAGAVAGQEVDYKNVSLGLAALTVQTIRELYIIWEVGQVVYEMTLGEVETSSLDRAGYTGVQIRQNVINPPIPLASRGWSHDLVFSATDFNTIAWESGTITTAGGVGSFAIDAGSVDIAALTFIYLDVATSLTVLQDDVDHANTVGGGKILVAVCKNVADEDTNKAIFQVFGGEGQGVLITADNIAADTITANEIAVNSIKTAHIDALQVTAAKIAANTITANKLYMGIGDSLFSNADGLLLFGPHCEISPTEWWSLRKQKATLSGAFHQEAGRWQGTRGLVVEEATTNYVTNPSFEVDTAGWVVVGGTAAITRITTDSVKGVACAEVEVDGDVDGSRAYIDTGAGTFVQNDEVTISAWVKGVAGESALLQVGELNNVPAWLAYVINTTITFDGTWQRVVHTATCAQAACDRLRLRWRENNADATFKVDGNQIEKKAYATSYCDGTLGTDYHWDGADHASTSHRHATTVTLDDYVGLVSGNDTLTFAFWIQMPYDSDLATWPTNPTLMSLYGSATERIFIRYATADDKFYAYRANGAHSVTSEAQTFKAGDWIQVIYTSDYANDVYKIYVNGLLEGTDTVADVAPTITEWALGHYCRAVANYGNFNFCEYAVFGRDPVLTADEVAAIYALQRPLVDVGSLDSPGIYILDGRFKIASSTSGNRIEITGNGIVAYDSAGNAATTLDKTGLLMTPTNADISRVKWGPDFASISAYQVDDGVDYHYLLIRCDPTGVSSEYSMVFLEAIGQGAHDDAMLGLVSEADAQLAQVYTMVGGDLQTRVQKTKVSHEVPLCLVPLGADPVTDVVDGMMYYNTGGGGQLRMRIGGAWKTIAVL